ncbi:MAG: hypothetical protein B7W97_00090 [Mycobacterium sp. 20-66-4]|nr:MAG: hypothetical protein B7W97_00090 [Mycobacterium sp. 20-66-4]
MRHDSRDDVDGDRSTRHDTDESEPDSAWSPGLVVIAAGVLALVVCVTNFALGEVGAGVAAAIICLMAFGAGLDWIGMDRRRIRQADRDWLASHPAAPYRRRL